MVDEARRIPVRDGAHGERFAINIPVRDGKYLDGLMRKQEGNGPFPAVILVSGLGMTMHEWNNSFDEISNRLVNDGILTLQFTFSIFYPDGSCRELPLDKRAAEFTDVLSWITKRQGVDTHRVGILAQSFGVPTVLCTDLTTVKSLVFVGGAYDPYTSISKVYKELGTMINYQGDTTLPRSSGENTTVGKEFWKSLASYDDIVQVKRIHQSAYMIHGDHDTKIPVSDAQKVFDAILNKNKKLKIFKGGDHGITDVPRPMREEFLRDVAEWFRKTL